MRQYFLILTMLIPFGSTAQLQVKGFFQTSGGTAIKSLAVMVKKLGAQQSGKSIVTDSAGFFAISIPDTGSYQLKPQSLFYRDTVVIFHVTHRDNVKDLGSIQLQPISKTMAKVIVAAKKEMIEFKDDHIAFTPAADPTVGSRPLVEVLSRIPGIAVDGKNKITAKGQDGVQVLVNSRIIRTAAGDYLAQLNADEVERVEIYDNATRFAYIKAPIIINVIMKTKQPKKLWNAAITANTLPKYNPSADASFAFGKQRVYARASHDVSNFNTAGFTRRWSDTLDFYQSFNNSVRHSMTTGRLGWDYYIDSATVLTAEGNFSRHTDAMKAHIGVSSVSGDFKNNIQSSPIEKELAAFVTYKKDRKQKGYALLELGVTKFDLRNNRNLPGLPFEEERNMNNSSTGFKAEWQKNIRKLKILNGVFAQLTKITDHIDTVSVAKVLKSKFLNKSITSYHEAGWQQKKWNFSVGANIDYIELDLTRSGQQSFSYQKAFINPSFKLNRVNGKSKASLTYNRKYTLPPTFMMFGQYSQYESGRISPGNYSLKPSVQNLIKLSFTKAKKATFLFELYYDMTTNPIIMLATLNNGIIIDRPENLESRKSYGVVFSLTYSPVSFYTFTLNSDGRINDHKLSGESFVLHPQTWSATANLVNRFTVNKKLNFSFNASIHNWRTTLYRDMKSFMVCTLQGSYKMNPKMSTSFSVHDIFNNMRFSYSGVIAPAFYEASFARDRMRNISVSLRYQLINSQMDKKGSTVKSFMSE